MKPFASWVGDMEGKILDASHIGPHTNEAPVIVPKEPKAWPFVENTESWTPEREATYEKWMKRHEDFEY